MMKVLWCDGIFWGAICADVNCWPCSGGGGGGSLITRIIDDGSARVHQPDGSFHVGQVTVQRCRWASAASFISTAADKLFHLWPTLMFFFFFFSAGGRIFAAAPLPRPNSASPSARRWDVSLPLSIPSYPFGLTLPSVSRLSLQLSRLLTKCVCVCLRCVGGQASKGLAVLSGRCSRWAWPFFDDTRVDSDLISKRASLISPGFLCQSLRLKKNNTKLNTEMNPDHQCSQKITTAWLEHDQYNWNRLEK